MKIIDRFKTLQFVRKHPIELLKLVEQIFKFIEETAEKKHPMMTKIATIEKGDNFKVNTLVNLWAGIGENDPIKRCGELKAQNEELKKLLKAVVNDELTDDLKLSIYLAIDHFN